MHQLGLILIKILIRSISSNLCRSVVFWVLVWGLFAVDLISPVTVLNLNVLSDFKLIYNFLQSAWIVSVDEFESLLEDYKWFFKFFLQLSNQVGLMVLSLIALCFSMHYMQLIMLCNFYMCVLRDLTFSCNLKPAYCCRLLCFR